MEDEILKRNTDCVYYLASPLTCKKGSECEFRHSETARLNPRDCWYWLSGNCLNPTCAFRHPPFEGLTETPSDSVHLPQHSVVTTSMTDVPCYFYFNAYCMKGDQCPFAHGTSDTLPARKVSKTASALPQEIKTSTGSDTGPASVEAPPYPTEGISKELTTEIHPKDVVESVAPNNIEPSLSPPSSMPECEEPAVKLPDHPSPIGEYINSRTDPCSDESSEELAKDLTEPEEWVESSPGFDVLVDDGSEQFAYEDDAEYLLRHDRESERLRDHLMQYDFEGSAAYDQMDYPADRFMYDHCLYDSYDHLDDGYTPDYVGRIPEGSRERILEPRFHRKRRLLPRDRDAEPQDGMDGMDLRDHLRKRKMMDVCQVSRSFRKRRPSCTKKDSSSPSGTKKDSSRERPLMHGIGRPFQGRWSSEVGRNMIGSSHSETEPTPNEDDRRGGRWDYRPSGRHVHSRQREREGRRGRQERQHSVLSDEIPEGSPMEKTWPTQALATGFTGPKTLAQIKEEKRKVNASGDGNGNLVSQHQRRASSTDFQGPKPLSELLKDKSPISASVNMNGSASKLGHNELSGFHPRESVRNGHLAEDSSIRHRSADRLHGDYMSDLSDDDDDNDRLAE